MKQIGNHVQALVIGGGVIGCAVLHALARRGVEALLVEAEPDLCEGTSKANSAIVHTGFDAHPGTLEARLLRRSAELWPSLLEELGVPFLPTGALMLAWTPEERDRLVSEVAANASLQGVRTELLDHAALRDIAPYVSETAIAALSIPEEGIIDPFWLTRAYAEAAIAAGANVIVGRTVVELSVEATHVSVKLNDGVRYTADQVFNCAGLWADEIARLAGDTSFSIHPRKGQFLISEETFGIDRILLPIPGPMGKGILVTPIVFGGILLGPTAEDQDDKTDRSTDPVTRERILKACSRLAPAVAAAVPIRQFAGLRTVSSTGDYILQPSVRGDRLFAVAGIRSTGISASPAIAEYVVEQASTLRGWQARSARAAQPLSRDRFVEAAGEIVCLCRSISRGELLAATFGPVPPTTLDALKRRCGIMLGDCQGNLCAVDAALTLVQEQSQPVTAILKHRHGSWLFAPSPEKVANKAPTPIFGPKVYTTPTDSLHELVIVGGGLTGLGAALAAVEAGVRPLVIERASRPGGALRDVLEAVGTAAEHEAIDRAARLNREGQLLLWTEVTAIGLTPLESGWAITVQSADGTYEVNARHVLLATGGYVEPLEHLPVPSSRGSGVITADFVHAAIDRGLRPGRRAILIGSGRYADATAARMAEAEMEVTQRVELVDGRFPVTEVRGDSRLEAVRINGDWHDTDTLVLAHRLVPATFLLHGTGMIDRRPGFPIPAGDDGTTSLPGIWAAGSCVHPDINHLGSLAAGLALGRRIAAQVGEA